jgi:hypothetical protein
MLLSTRVEAELEEVWAGAEPEAVLLEAEVAEGPLAPAEPRTAKLSGHVRKVQQGKRTKSLPEAH